MYNNWENTPDWVLFVAKDADGVWYGYDEKPAMGREEWVSIGERYVFLYRGVKRAARDWKESLQMRTN
jgi:hypothetical protein